eukprot:5520922-Prymnesium_polylepis.1
MAVGAELAFLNPASQQLAGSALPFFRLGTAAACGGDDDESEPGSPEMAMPALDYSAESSARAPSDAAPPAASSQPSARTSGGGCGGGGGGCEEVEMVGGDESGSEEMDMAGLRAAPAGESEVTQATARGAAPQLAAPSVAELLDSF